MKEIKIQELIESEDLGDIQILLVEINKTLINKNVELTALQFSTLLINAVLEPLRERINELEISIKGRTGRTQRNKRSTLNKLSLFTKRIYSLYPAYLSDYEGYVKFIKTRDKSNLQSRDFIINLEGDSLDTILYPLYLDISKLEQSKEEIKDFIRISLNKPEQFEFGKYHLNHYYNNILSTINTINNVLLQNEKHGLKLKYRNAQTSYNDMYYDDEEKVAKSIKDEINSQIIENDIENSNLEIHKEIIEDLRDFIKTFYRDLLEEKTTNSNDTLSTQLIESNPFPEIFKSDKAYSLFNKFSKSINPKTQLADFSFIYRKMIKDNLIYDTLGDSDYRRWLDKEYETTIDKTKVLKYCTTPSKVKTYDILKEQFSI